MRRRSLKRSRGVKPRPPDYPEPYKFRHLPVLSRSELEAIQNLYLYLPPTFLERALLDELSEALSQLLGGRVFIRVHSVEHLKFGEWRSKLPDTGSSAIFRLLPHQSAVALHLDHALVGYLLGRLTGAGGASPADLRPLSAVEKGVMEFVLLHALAVVEEGFGHMAQVKPRLERFEDGAHGLYDVALDEDRVVVINMEFVLASVERGGGAPSLTFLDGPTPGGVIELGEGVFDLAVGRGEKAPLRIPHRSLSREHARLRREGDRTELMDLQSRNKTLVNGQELVPHQPVVLANGDLLKFGAVSLQYSDPESEIIVEEQKDFLSLCVPYPFVNEVLIAPYQGQGLTPVERAYYLDRARRLGGAWQTSVRAEIGHITFSAAELESVEEGDVLLIEEPKAERLPDGSYRGEVLVRVGRGEAFVFQGTIVSGDEVLAIQLMDYAIQEALTNVVERI